MREVLPGLAVWDWDRVGWVLTPSELSALEVEFAERREGRVSQYDLLSHL